MNQIAEVREEYKSAVRAYITQVKGSKIVYRRPEFYEGRMSGLEASLRILGIDNDGIRDMYKLCEEVTMDELAMEVDR